MLAMVEKIMLNISHDITLLNFSIFESCEKFLKISKIVC